jgi:type III secretory pathway component EscS
MFMGVKKFIQRFSSLLVLLISFPVIAANSVIDVLVVYTQGTADLY